MKSNQNLNEDHIEKLFSLLDDWRNLPAYQLERRADIFFAIYIEEIIQSKFGLKVSGIIPEFPVRVGEIYPDLPNLNKSFKIDYAAICEEANKVFLIELKTDNGSRNPKQDWYLERAKHINIKALMDGIIKISKASNSRVKYNNLIAKLQGHGWLDLENGHCVNRSRDYEIEVIYLQPQNPESLDYVISFEEVITLLSIREDFFTKRFIKSLGKWSINPN